MTGRGCSVSRAGRPGPNPEARGATVSDMTPRAAAPEKRRAIPKGWGAGADGQLQGARGRCKAQARIVPKNRRDVKNLSLFSGLVAILRGAADAGAEGPGGG